MNFIEDIIENTKSIRPLIHNINNYVTANDCANVILACGGAPIMADDPCEVEEITAVSNALVINLGTISRSKAEAMILAGRKANELKIPVIFDPVGIGASGFRSSITAKLLKEVHFDVIKGNLTEIKTLIKWEHSSGGVDADKGDVIEESSMEQAIHIAEKVAEETDSVIVITGAIDIICSKGIVHMVRNGSKLMKRITGTGCMLSSVIGAFCGGNPSNCFEAAVTAVGAMGLCGELAENKVLKKNEGTGSFKVYLMDYMSSLQGNTLKEGIRIESK